MRAMMCILWCLATPAFSETFTVRSAPSAVLVYNGAAKVSREFTIQLPAGRHEVILPDLPYVVEDVLPQIEVLNATLGPVSVRSRSLPPLVGADANAVTAARNLVKANKTALAEHMDTEAGIRAEADAAKAQIEFLKSLGQNEGLPADAAGLSEVATMIGGQTLQARQKILETERIIRALTDLRDELGKDVKNAEDALAALLTADEDRAQVQFSLSTDVEVTAEVAVSYFAPASWTPQYEVALLKADPVTLSIARGAAIAQHSGEDWIDVKMSLSTLQVEDGLVPSNIRPRRLRLADPLQQSDRARLSDGVSSLAEPIIEAPVIIESAELPSVNYEGPGVTYSIPNTVTVANEVEATRVSFDTVTFAAEVFARAVPLHDDTAFLMARFENTSGEPFFEVPDALFTVDNRFVGLEWMPEIAAGDHGVLAFGSIEDLRLERDVLNRQEGDTGIISRSNARNEEIQITARNLGSEEWDVELLDRLPYSEHEDLVVSFTSSPEPDQENVDAQRGILMWKFNLAPGGDKLIEVEQNLRWPEGKILR